MTPRRERLTEAFIEGLTYPYDVAPGAVHPSYMVYDLGVSGFCVRVYPSGRKSYVMRYMLNGRRRLITIAQCAYVTLDDARRMAAKVRADIHAGVDPLDGAR